MKIWTDLEAVLVTTAVVTGYEELGSLFSDCLDLDLRALPRPLNADPEADHSFKKWTTTVFAKILLGDAFIFDRKEFHAVQEGFKSVFILNEDPTPFALQFSLSLYDSFSDPDKLVHSKYNRLTFVLVDRQKDDKLACIMKDMFQARTKRYLVRPGHPQTGFVMDGLITPEVADRDKDNGLLRCRSFLEAATGSSHLPLHDEFFHITVYITHHTRGKEDEDEFPVMVFHTCSATVDVTINSWLQNEMLSQKEDKISVDDGFDSWLHSQVWNAGADFNIV